MGIPPNDTPSPGGLLHPQQIAGYTILNKIGSGGMATVYRAYHAPTGREVALKVLAIHLQDQADIRARFQREAYMLQQFRHPHILPVYDYGEDGETIYLAMQLLDGRSLADVLQDGVPLSHAAIGRYTREIAGALDYAHARGIIHRDIKPANILLDAGDAVLLADFGVAHPTADNARMTGAGAFIGTAAYASPEQCRGDPLDRRSDIYALAVLTFQMATGRLPFEASSALAVIKLHLTERPPNPLAYNPTLPVALYDVLLRGMAKAPDDRYPSALAFSEAVDRALGLHVPPDIDADARDDWLDGDLAPVTVDAAAADAGTGDSHAPGAVPDDVPPAREVAGLPEPGADPDQLITFEDLPPAGTLGDPFAGISPDEYDVSELIFDEYADLEPPDDALSFAAAFGALDAIDPDEAEPVVIPRPQPDAVRVVNGVIRPLVAPPTIERRTLPPPPKTRGGWLYVVLLLSVLLLALVAAGAMLAWRARNNDREDDPTTYSDPTLGITFEYPQRWHRQRGLAAVLSPADTATLALSDAPVPVAGPYTGAAIVITLQQIDPVAVFDVPPVCRYALPDGPGETFTCMRAWAYVTPVYDPFHSPHAWGVMLPGTLPPEPASIPVVLLPTGDTPWLAVAIAHWDGYADARATLVEVAASVH